MITEAAVLKRTFARMGARLDVRSPSVSDASHRINVTDEAFELRLATGLEASVLDVRPADRHLLLLIRDNPPRKYLCGHDERHWFVAGVPSGARSVQDAMDLLQPEAVRAAVQQAGIRGQRRFRRRNQAYLRQGEWFFVPAPDLVVPDGLVLANEPVQRGASKPHMVQRLFRRGGTPVVLCPHYPTGLTDAEFEDSFARQFPGHETPHGWWGRQPHGQRCRKASRRMVRDAEVYATGRVSHPDHATINLRGWHRVYLNTEMVERRFQAFLD